MRTRPISSTNTVGLFCVSAAEFLRLAEAFLSLTNSRLVREEKLTVRERNAKNGSEAECLTRSGVLFTSESPGPLARSLVPSTADLLPNVSREV